MTSEEEQYFRDMLSLVCAGCVHCWDAEKCKECLFSKLSELAIEALKERPNGEWIFTGRKNIYGGTEIECSNCRNKLMVSMSRFEVGENFCDICGSQNKKEGESE